MTEQVELREEIARIIGLDYDTERNWSDYSVGVKREFLQIADQILSLPRIARLRNSNWRKVSTIEHRLSKDCWCNPSTVPVTPYREGEKKMSEEDIHAPCDSKDTQDNCPYMKIGDYIDLEKEKSYLCSDGSITHTVNVDALIQAVRFEALK
ncbi:MAG: hypothetical protein PHQ86_09255, partial [Dehalococcoidales bacterium]|nr:hypothetical protein [Dehalococcoidales bacterium]